jgi:flagellin-like protein
MTAINRLFKSRKAVSPLIATVLLIAFAVALGAVVMNWGRGYVEDTANIARERSDTEVKCASEVDIQIVEIDSVPQVCYNDTGTNFTIMFIVENKKTRNVEKIEGRIIGTATRVPYIQSLGDNSNLSINEAKLLNMSYVEATYGVPQQIKLTPSIKVGGTTVACPSSAEISTNIKPCSQVFI